MAKAKEALTDAAGSVIDPAKSPNLTHKQRRYLVELGFNWVGIVSASQLFDHVPPDCPIKNPMRYHFLQLLPSGLVNTPKWRYMVFSEEWNNCPFRNLTELREMFPNVPRARIWKNTTAAFNSRLSKAYFYWRARQQPLYPTVMPIHNFEFYYDEDDKREPIYETPEKVVDRWMVAIRLEIAG